VAAQYPEGVVVFVVLAGVPLLLLWPWLVVLDLLPRGARSETAEASIWDVVVLDRKSFGRATVRIGYLIQRDDGSTVYAIRETTMKVSQAPHAGEHVSVRFDPRDPQSFEVVTTAGTETYGPQGPLP
jgi:hypothetical protein